MDNKKKLLQFNEAEFGRAIGEHIQVSVRYDYLSLTPGKNVSVRWKEEDLTFTVSGSYWK